MDRNRDPHHTQPGKRRGPILLLILVLLALLAAAGAAIRMLGWRGQQVEGTLTALVNPWNSVDASGYVPNLVTVRNVQVDQSCAASLEQMLSSCEEAGLTPSLTVGYISRSELERMPSQSPENAVPGYSEHELGLAVDFQAEEPEDQTLAWLQENAWRYGFILRYPSGSEAVTGTPFSPCHFRFVGGAAASQIHQLGITLEEYVTMFYNDSAAVIFE